jgi:hypothetical protein
LQERHHRFFSPGILLYLVEDLCPTITANRVRGDFEYLLDIP